MVYYNLIVCCSLHPVLVIWYVILVIFLEIQCNLSKLKKCFWERAVLVILIIIYVNLCDCLLSPMPGGNKLPLHVNLYLYLCNCILFCVFSCFYWGRTKFNKFDCILALFVLVCVYKFGIFQYILKCKCICICILSYYTYSGTEYLDSLFDHNT